MSDEDWEEVCNEVAESWREDRDLDDITDGPISIERAKHHCGCLALDCGWRAMEVEMHIDAQAKRIAALEAENQQLTQENQRLRSEIMAHTQRIDEIHRTARSVLDKYPQYERPE